MKYVILVCLIALICVSCAKAPTTGEESTKNDDVTNIEEEPIACTMDAKLCPDGSSVGRNSQKGCAFDTCPDPKPCDANTQCPEGYSCWSVQTEDTPVCLIGSGEDICMIACGSPACEVAESYPPQVFCE